METEPGQEAQIDFGTAAFVIGADGKKRRPWMFRIVLSCSRKAYSEVVWRQTTDNFIAAIENSFHYFGGVPKTLVIDNLKAAVQKADWYDPEIHPKLQSFAAHYGTAILPPKPYTPGHKGKVESGVEYAKNNALKGHTFGSLAEQNDHLPDWESTVADTRIHGTTKKQVRGQFIAVDRPALMPLPRDRFAMFHEARRSVSCDGHLEVDKAYYSAPPEYIGRRVWYASGTRLVRVWYASGTRLVRVWYASGTRLVRVWCASSTISGNKSLCTARRNRADFAPIRLIFRPNKLRQSNAAQTL